MQLTISFNCENDAFQDGQHDLETARILRDVANDIEVGCYYEGTTPVRDINGNTIGSINIQYEY